MKPDLPSNPSVVTLAVILLAGLIRFPAIVCQETRPYDVCGQPIQCGNGNPDAVAAYYPFWGQNRPAYCGRSGFQLTCPSDVLLLRYEPLSYRVLDMDPSTQTITIARDDLWTDNCPEYLYDTAYNSTIFNDDNFEQENVSLSYGCNETTNSFPIPFDCRVNESHSTNYFTRRSLVNSNISSDLARCKNQIRVPMNQNLANRLVTIDELRSALTAGFKLQWSADNDECENCGVSGGRCGSNSTVPSLFACYCADGNFSITCNNSPPKSKGSNGVERNSTFVRLITGSNWKSTLVRLVIGIPIGIAVTMLLLIVLRRRHINNKRFRETRKTTDHKIEIFMRDYKHFAPKRYKYSEIKKMTNSFLEKLGQGGYGSVYKGQLPDGRLVAVKLLGSGAKGDGEDFINEVTSIIRTSHVNIVALLGFCFEGKKRALMYEFMPNGSLDKFIRSDNESTVNSSSHLDWNMLFRIALGIARGLEYLHQGCNTRIVHFDIKPHNILLDEEFVPKISDFGLAKLCKRKESIMSITGARGTVGYIAPEVFFKSFGGVSHKSDVYSYGMMVLEMTGARKNNIVRVTSTSEMYFPEWIYTQVENKENLEVHGVTTEGDEELARKMMMVSLWCIQSDPSDRPSISKVVEMLEGRLESLQVPPRRFQSSPIRPPQGSSSLATQSSDLSIAQ